MDLCECLWCVLSFENHANREMTYTVKQQCFPFLFSRKNEEIQEKKQFTFIYKAGLLLLDITDISHRFFHCFLEKALRLKGCSFTDSCVCASVRVFLRSAMPGILIIKLSKEMSAMAETPADSCSIVL